MMTHDELVRIAETWLYDVQDCDRVLVSIKRDQGECPDAWGIRLRDQNSCVVEVKISAEDWRADFRKPSRISPWTGLGNQRWYMIPHDMPVLTDLPAGWGVLRVLDDGRVLEDSPSSLFDWPALWRHERALLAVMLQTQRGRPATIQHEETVTPEMAHWRGVVVKAVVELGPITLAALLRITGHPWKCADSEARKRLARDVKAGRLSGIVLDGTCRPQQLRAE